MEKFEEPDCAPCIVIAPARNVAELAPAPNNKFVASEVNVFAALLYKFVLASPKLMPPAAVVPPEGKVSKAPGVVVVRPILPALVT